MKKPCPRCKGKRKIVANTYTADVIDRKGKTISKTSAKSTTYIPCPSCK